MTDDDNVKYITLSEVENFSSSQKMPKPTTLSGLVNILAMRHLRPLYEPHVVQATVDHKQTAQLALVNGILTQPTLPRPMPPGFRINPEGGSYGNDKDYDARFWGHADANASLDQVDFQYKHSVLVRKALEFWIKHDSLESTVQHGVPVVNDRLQRMIDCQLQMMICLEKERVAHITTCQTHTVPEACHCGTPCLEGCNVCEECMITKLVPSLRRNMPEVEVETPCKVRPVEKEEEVIADEVDCPLTSPVESDEEETFEGPQIRPLR